MLYWRAKKRGVAAKGTSRASLTRLSAKIPATPVAPAATKLAEAEKHIAFAHSSILDVERRLMDTQLPKRIEPPG
jgi:hypothetical protein